MVLVQNLPGLVNSGQGGYRPTLGKSNNCPVLGGEGSYEQGSPVTPLTLRGREGEREREGVSEGLWSQLVSARQLWGGLGFAGSGSGFRVQGLGCSV